MKRKVFRPRARTTFRPEAALRCGYCRKLSYPRRSVAKKALRVLYPGDVGHDMNAYRCTAGGTGWHIGHRDEFAADLVRRHRERNREAS